MAAPSTANIKIKVAGQDIQINHKNFSELSIDRTAKDVCDKFSLSVLDDDTFTIEAALLRGTNNDIEVTYIDDTKNIYKNFYGYVISLSDSFVDNRCMLTMTGIVSTSLKDKFEKFSVPWNIVPKFDWEDVLGTAGKQLKDANYEDDAGLDQFYQKYLKGHLTSYLLNLLFSPAGWINELIMGTSADWKDIIDKIFEKDLISMDDNGNYYVQKYKYWSDPTYDQNVMNGTKMDEKKETKRVSKSTGSYVIPIQPHKLIKLICCGGKFSDLLLDKFTDYRGTSFYTGDSNDEGETEEYNEADWYFIKKWFEKMGSFPGLGFTTFRCDEETEFEESEMNQTRQSYLEFLYNDVLNRCYKEDKDGNKYSNFYLSFEGKTAILKRLDSKQTPQNAEKYMYYGKFNDNGVNKGRMTTFSPKLEILTSMITQGNTVIDGADISTKNLISSEAGENEITVSADKALEDARYKVQWGAIKVANSVVSTANNKLAGVAVQKVFDEASKLAYTAEATIEGFNKLCPQDYLDITIIPTRINGMTSYHHLSGMYFILSIKDTIKNGKYTSSLSLIKNINAMGNTATITRATKEADKEIKYVVTSDEKSNSATPGSAGTGGGGGGGSSW